MCVYMCVSCISELLIVSVCFERRMGTFFFTSALPTLFTTLRVLSVDSMSKLNVIFKPFHLILIPFIPFPLKLFKCLIISFAFFFTMICEPTEGKISAAKD